MDRGDSHLHTFDVRGIEALSSQPYRHQDDDRLPGLVAQRVRGRLAQCRLTQAHHVLFVHYRSTTGKTEHFKLPLNGPKLEG